MISFYSAHTDTNLLLLHWLSLFNTNITFILFYLAHTQDTLQVLCHIGDIRPWEEILIAPYIIFHFYFFFFSKQFLIFCWFDTITFTLNNLFGQICHAILSIIYTMLQIGKVFFWNHIKRSRKKSLKRVFLSSSK